MGAGKTTVGQALARRLQWDFCDSDHELEARTGVSVATIFEIEGEPVFREREAAVIDELLQREGIVLATGGGAILHADTRRRLTERASVVYLHARPETSYARTRRNRDRPLLQVADPLGRLHTLYDLRDPLYRSVAHCVIESGHAPPAVAVQQIIDWLGV